MTLKNVFIFPVLWLSGEKAGRQRQRAALAVGEAGTPRGQLSAGAQVSAGRAPAGETGSPCCPCGVMLLPLHQHPGTAGKELLSLQGREPGCVPAHQEQLHSFLEPGAGGVRGVLAMLGGEEHVSSVAQPLTGRWQGSWVCQEESGERRWHFLGASLWVSPGSSPALGGRCQAGSHLPRSTAGACGVLEGGLDLRREEVRAGQKGRH